MTFNPTLLKYFFLAFFSLTITVKAQNSAFNSGEKLLFSASYNMSGILTDIAQVTMETSTVNISNTSLLRLKCAAATYSKWDNFFKIRDLYESYVSPNTVVPFLYKRDVSEGEYNKFEQYKYSHKTATINSTVSKKKKDKSTVEKKKSFTFSKNAKDIVSLLYYLRTLDLKPEHFGKLKSFKVLFDEKEYTVTATHLGSETINTALGKKSCYKLGITLNKSNVLKGTNANLIWFTADENKIPVYATFKIPVGNGELKIKSATGLKN